jgi:CheY-like chemotaxis protein
VILDLTVRGGMGGVETVGRLREVDPDVVAVASSGYSDDASPSVYREQGFAAFLKKPYNMKELRELLNVVLG